MHYLFVRACLFVAHCCVRPNNTRANTPPNHPPKQDSGLICAQYSVRDTSALHDTPLMRACGVAYYLAVNALLCRFCGYLHDCESLGHVHQQHGPQIRASAAADAQVLSQVGKSSDHAALVAALLREITSLCGSLHGWVEAAEAEAAEGGEGGDGEQQQ